MCHKIIIIEYNKWMSHLRATCHKVTRNRKEILEEGAFELGFEG